MADYSYETFYDGGYSSLNPDYGNFIGYRMNASQIGFPGSAQTANQLNEAINAIKQGAKAFEVTMVSPETADIIPKQHFAELRALMKLTGVRPSVHGPIIDAAGFGERGWDGELVREDAERRMFEAVKKSHEIDPKGNIPVVFHSSGGVPGTEWRPDKDVEPGEEGRFKEKKLIVIDQETGQLATKLEEERKFHPTGMKEEEWKEGKLISPRDYMKVINENEWKNKLTNLAFYKKESDEILKKMAATPGILDLAKREIKSDKDIEELIRENPQAWHELQQADLFLQNNLQTFTSLFHKAYKYGSEEQKKKLREMAEQWKEEQKKLSSNPYEQHLEYAQLMAGKIAALHNTTKARAPEIYKPVEDFAMDKAAETFGSLAFKSYDKFGDNSPVIAIENMMQGMAFSRAKDMKKLVEKSKDVFVKKAVEEGVSESEAKKQADKLIGVTWDVGHLNMMRKAGFKEEDVVEETKKIAKLVKHIHLTDNFGYSDSHLPPGMGNVPFKKILEELEKSGKLEKVRKIVEAPNFVQHFKKSPHPFILAAFGSPIYGAKMAPYWNQMEAVRGNYFGFPLAYMPEKHFSTYGSGFSSLPEELGGQIPGTQSRFSGTANA